MPSPLYPLERHLEHFLKDVGCALGAVWTGKGKTKPHPPTGLGT